MAIFNKVVGYIDALGAQARTYKMGIAASRAKALATDIAVRSGGLTSMKRYAAFGAGVGAIAGGAYNYYNGGDMRSIAGGAMRGGIYGGIAGAGFRLGSGIRSSFRGGMLGSYTSSATGTARAFMRAKVEDARMMNSMSSYVRNYV